MRIRDWSSTGTRTADSKGREERLQCVLKVRKEMRGVAGVGRQGSVGRLEGGNWSQEVMKAPACGCSVCTVGSRG